MAYIFHTPAPQPSFGALPEGDYSFIVTSAEEPYLSPAGNLVLPIKIAIQPGGEPVFANPWARTDKSPTQDGRDDIARFLICINRAPRDGEEPVWHSLTGAKGKCRLAIEIARQGALAGKEVNKVHFFHAPVQVGPKPADPLKATSASKSEFEAARKRHAAPSAGISGGDPDDIPYDCNRY